MIGVFNYVGVLIYDETMLVCDQVRKEKMGDRITALQQLVAPFGKVFSNIYYYTISKCDDGILALSFVSLLGISFSIWNYVRNK